MWTSMFFFLVASFRLFSILTFLMLLPFDIVSKLGKSLYQLQPMSLSVISQGEPGNPFRFLGGPLELNDKAIC